MDEHVSIVTPDQIDLEFELAGLGSRALALLVDALVIGGAVLALVFAAVFGGLRAVLGTWGIALLVFGVFLAQWGYFLLFEALNGGQTPGKKNSGIRVVRDDGLPVGWREAALRNLVRAVDMMPFPACLVGALSVGLSKRGKRLGDLLAGTIVVREDFGFEGIGDGAGWEAAWVARARTGGTRRGLTLADMKVEAHQIQIIERFLARRDSLPMDRRQTFAWRIAEPFLSASGEDPEELARRSDRFAVCERILAEIMKRAREAPAGAVESEGTSAADSKRQEWTRFEGLVTGLRKAGKEGLRRLGPDQLAEVIRGYRSLTCDLGRARTIARNSAMVERLNQIAVQAHNVMYGHIRTRNRRPPGSHWATRFPRAARGHWSAVGLSALLLFGPATISYVAVQLHPELGYDLVGPGFLDFEPAREDSLNEIPSIARPMAASSIISNNLQVTLLAFGLGMTAGIGTSFLLVFNGIYLGAVAGWMTSRGDAGAFWGWVMPHGGTELLAIVLAGAAGFILAGAIIAPGEVTRATALRRVAVNALIIELGVMAMLVFAGLIEGFISPSDIDFNQRILVLGVTLTFWFAYLGLAGLRSNSSSTRKTGSLARLRVGP